MEMQAGDSVTKSRFSITQNSRLCDSYLIPDTREVVHLLPRLSNLSKLQLLETQAGVEPANGGFANRSVRPLRHCVIILSSLKFFHSNIISINTLENFFTAWYSYQRYTCPYSSAGRASDS